MALDAAAKDPVHAEGEPSTGPVAVPVDLAASTDTDMVEWAETAEVECSPVADSKHRPVVEPTQTTTVGSATESLADAPEAELAGLPESGSPAEATPPELAAPPDPRDEALTATLDLGIDRARSSLRRAPLPSTDDVLESMPPEEAFRAYIEEVRPTEDLDVARDEVARFVLEVPLRAVIDMAGRSLGRVTRLSASSLWVDTGQPRPIGTPVTVEWILLGGHALEFHGTVTGRSEEGMGIRLETDDTTWVFRSSFVELACSDGLGRRPEVRLRARIGESASSDTTPLWSAWRQAERALHDDALQQRFIQACLVKRRLEFALERYKAVRTASPGRSEPDKYLNQIGTLLGFSGLAPTDKEELGARGRYFKLFAITLVFLSLAWLLSRWVGARNVAPDATVEDYVGAPEFNSELDRRILELETIPPEEL